MKTRYFEFNSGVNYANGSVITFLPNHIEGTIYEPNGKIRTWGLSLYMTEIAKSSCKEISQQKAAGLIFKIKKANGQLKKTAPKLKLGDKIDLSRTIAIQELAYKMSDHARHNRTYKNPPGDFVLNSKELELVLSLVPFAYFV